MSFDKECASVTAMVAFGRAQDFLRRAVDEVLRGDHVAVLESVALVRGQLAQIVRDYREARGESPVKEGQRCDFDCGVCLLIANKQRSAPDSGA